MSQKLRLPDISGATDKEKIRQIKSYLQQTVSQLNWILEGLSAPAAYGESAPSLFARLKPYILSSGELARTMERKLKKAFVSTDSLPQGLCVQFCPESNQFITVQSRFPKLDPEGDQRQTFFLFGTLQGAPVWEVMTLCMDGTLYHQNRFSPTVTQQGQILLPVAQEDRLLVLTYLED